MIKASDDFKKLLQNVETYANNKLMFEDLGDNELEFYKAVKELVLVLSKLINTSPSEIFLKTQLEEIWDDYESIKEYYDEEDDEFSKGQGMNDE